MTALEERAEYNRAVPDPPALTLDQFALITARLRAGAKRERALAEADIDTTTWLAAQVYWLGRMASLVANGDNVLHTRFLERLAKLEQEGPAKLSPMEIEKRPAAPEPRLAPLRAPSPPAVDVPVVVPSPVVIPSRLDAPTPDLDLNSTMGGPSPWGSKSSPVIPFAAKNVTPGKATGEQAHAEALRPSLPFGKQPSSTPPPRATSGAVPVGDDTGRNANSQTRPLDDTADDDNAEFAPRYVLPFAGRLGKAPAAIEPATPVRHPARGATMGFAMPPAAASATPFGTQPNPEPAESDPEGMLSETGDPDPSPIAKRAVAFDGTARLSPSITEKPPESADGMGMTVDGSVISPFHGGALPFASGASGKAAPPAVAPKSDPEMMGKTMGLDMMGSFAGIAVPFGGAQAKGEQQASQAEVSIPQLNVEQYASLCATCEVYPGRLREAYERYGAPTAEACAALDKAWRKRMQGDILLEGRFQKLLTEYRNWLRSQQG